MITNLVASVVVFFTTNVTEVVTERDAPEVPELPRGFDGGMMYNPMVTFGAPMAKTITTTVTEVSEMTFKWAGTEHKVTSKKEISKDHSYWVRNWQSSTNAGPMHDVIMKGELLINDILYDITADTVIELESIELEPNGTKLAPKPKAVR